MAISNCSMRRYSINKKFIGYAWSRIITVPIFAMAENKKTSEFSLGGNTSDNKCSIYTFLTHQRNCLSVRDQRGGNLLCVLFP